MAKKYIETWDASDGSQVQAAPLGTLNTILVDIAPSTTLWLDVPADGEVIGFKGFVTGGAAGAAAKVTLTDGDGNTIGDTGTALNSAADGTVFFPGTIDDDYNVVTKGGRLGVVTAAGTTGKVNIELALK